MLWFAESTGVAQEEDPATSIGAEDSTVQTSAGEPSAVEFAVTSVALEAATPITVPEVSVTCSMSDEQVVGLTPAQVELVPVAHPVMERVSESTLAGLSPANNIMEELARQMVRQFFASMRSYIDLFLSRGSLLSLPGCFSRIRSRTSLTLGVLRRLGHAWCWLNSWEAT